MTPDRTVRNQPAWRRSTRCITEHHCVEVAWVPDGVALRNSQRPAVVLLLSQAGWRDLVAGIKAGGFDSPTGLTD